MKAEVLPGVKVLGVLAVVVAAARPLVWAVALGVTIAKLFGADVSWSLILMLFAGPYVAAWVILLWGYLGLLWGVGPGQANLYARNIGRLQAKQWRDLKAAVRDAKRAITTSSR